MSITADGWLEARMDEVPGELRPWLEPVDAPSAPDVPGELVRRGLAALAAAAERPGRDREAAFRLLAADAYLTWACEAILEGPEPGAALDALMDRIPAEVE